MANVNLYKELHKIKELICTGISYDMKFVTKVNSERLSQGVPVLLASDAVLDFEQLIRFCYSNSSADIDKQIAEISKKIAVGLSRTNVEKYADAANVQRVRLTALVDRIPICTASENFMWCTSEEATALSKEAAAWVDEDSV